MSPKYKQRFEESLAAGNAQEQLIQLIHTMKAEGMSQIEVYLFFEAPYVLAQKEERQTDEDVLVEVLDLIWGWCPPSARLFSRNLDNGEVAQYRKSKE